MTLPTTNFKSSPWNDKVFVTQLIAEVARSFGMTPNEQAELSLLAPRSLEGQVNGQVSSPAGLGEGRALADQRAMQRLFNQGMLQWKTSRGVGHAPSREGATSGKRLDGQLWQTEAGLCKYGRPLYAVYSHVTRTQASVHPATVTLSDREFLQRLASAACANAGTVCQAAQHAWQAPTGNLVGLSRRMSV